MIQSHEPAILDLAIISLHGAIRRAATRLLEGSGELEVTQICRVERLMRIALDLAGAGNGLPLVEFHGIPPAAGMRELPEILAIPLTDLLPARAADHLPAALEGDPEALRAFEEEAERLLETEDIQRLV
jgi:hypothetical protein